MQFVKQYQSRCICSFLWIYIHTVLPPPLLAGADQKLAILFKFISFIFKNVWNLLFNSLSKFIEFLIEFHSSTTTCNHHNSIDLENFLETHIKDIDFGWCYINLDATVCLFCFSSIGFIDLNVFLFLRSTRVLVCVCVGGI